MTTIKDPYLHRLLALAAPRLRDIPGAFEQFSLDAPNMLLYGALGGIDMMGFAPAHKSDPAFIRMINDFLKSFTSTETATPAPVVAGGKKWTDEKLADLKAYRETHTMPETAEHFEISVQRIRDLLPSKKPKAKPFAVLINRAK